MRPGDDSGFSLATGLMVVMLLSSLTLLLHLRGRSHMRAVAGIESQLHSMVAAENGIELARALVPLRELDDLLAGPDGVFCAQRPAQWRNPLSFDEALRIDVRSWEPPCDDGLPESTLLQLGKYRSGDGSFFLVRFSNNPEEDPQSDADGVILARSMGLVPSTLSTPGFPSLRNSVSLIEARFRQERPFTLPAALTLHAGDGRFTWKGDRFLVDGRDGCAVTVARSDLQVRESLLESLTPAQEQRLAGAGASPSVCTAGVEAPEPEPRLLDCAFWDYFARELPRVAGARDSVLYLPEGGEWSEAVEGLVVARGDLVLGSGSRILGVLLHLGGGRLELQDDAAIQGAVWMSSLSCEEPLAPPLDLSLAGTARIVHDRAAVASAQRLLPATQLEWRMLFPETVQ